MGADERFAREKLLVGDEGLDVLASSHVAIFGIGGVGSFCAEALARGGVGELTFIDSDIVQCSNINRQLIALESTIGQPKVSVMAKRARDINPAIRIHEKLAWFGEESANELLAGEFDYVADAIDSVESKLLLMKKCHLMGIPIVSSMGAGNKLDASGFAIADISDTHTCPLAKAMRVKLRKEGITSGIKVVFSSSLVNRHSPGPPGSISYVPPVAGLMMAQAIIRDLLAKGNKL
jgi:tRNA A37 threonylcarbamoyladenosine dehydratase